MDVRSACIFLIALLSYVNYCREAAKQTSVQGWILDPALLLWLILLETILTSHGMLYNLHEYCRDIQSTKLLQVSTWPEDLQKREKQQPIFMLICTKGDNE